MATSDGNGLGEGPQQGFEADHSLEAYAGIQKLVLSSYGYRCALTGARFAVPAGLLHPDLDVIAIQPREEGGTLSVGNYLPMIYSLRQPFRAGLLTVGEDYAIIVPRPELLGRDMLSALRSRLVVPDESLLRPDPSYLAYHRRYALGR